MKTTLKKENYRIKQKWQSQALLFMLYLHLLCGRFLHLSNYYFLILLLMTVAYIVAIVYTVIAIFNKTSKDDHLGRILTIIAALTPFIELIVCILGAISIIRLM